ncbi:Tripartite motif-containing protein 75 [Microtus ochrogaster]|uniref:Tripartite motif-containing protein 75 n=1 Tax=Microtus ochrogaster TaxID=79684 RepID=A0A8J6L421_MICOH|nr:Tripartite motif-containing protein 75 [Microtus ochrogaster]
MIVERAQDLYSFTGNSNSQETNTRCDQHNQVLTFFCEDDLQLLCDQCMELGSHNNHQVTPMHRLPLTTGESFTD